MERCGSILTGYQTILVVDAPAGSTKRKAEALPLSILVLTLAPGFDSVHSLGAVRLALLLRSTFWWRAPCGGVEEADGIG